MPLPGLRFRPTATRETPTEIPKTPRSPPGVYSGVPVPPLSRSRRRRKHWRKSFGLLVCILICTYLLICWWSTDALLQSRKWPLPQIPWQSPIRVSIRFGKTETKTKSFAPHFHTHEHRFRDDAAFQDSTSRGDNAWLSMFPSGDGSIAVKNPRQYGLPPSSVAVDGQGNKVVDTEIYDVSVVRQLGCLVSALHVFLSPQHGSTVAFNVEFIESLYQSKRETDSSYPGVAPRLHHRPRRHHITRKLHPSSCPALSRPCPPGIALRRRYYPGAYGR